MNVGQRLADLRWMIDNCRCEGIGQILLGNGQTGVCPSCAMLRGEYAALTNMQVVPR